MEWINFRQLYAFWMVCKHGGFQNAANRMFVSQSAISDHVAQLEDYFEEKLFDRTTRSVKLTKVGSDLMKYAESIFSQSREINQVIRDKQDIGAPKSLNVGMVGGISRNFVFRSLSKILGQNPDTKIDVISGAYEELIYLLRTYELDLIISFEVPQKKDLGTFAYSTIGNSALCLAGKKRLINLAKRGGNDKALDLYNFKHPFERDIVKDVLEKRMKLRINPRLETDDISLLRFFANSGEGLVMIPEVGVQEDVKNAILGKLSLKRLPAINFHAIYLKDSLHQEMIKDLF